MGIYNTIDSIDRKITPAVLKIIGEKPKIISFYFHGIFADEKELNADIVDPQQRFTVNDFKRFFEYFLESGYKFISPDDVSGAVDTSAKNILMTFDDGYYSNSLILPLLNEYKIPALFFISTNHIKQNKAFWVDVAYRNRKKQGAGIQIISEEQVFLKSKKHDFIDKYLVENFGKDSLKPTCDIDRTFTPSELKKFSEEKFVHIGNHTTDHAVLTNYEIDEAKDQIVNAQNDLLQITGKLPDYISFPNGNHNDELVRVSSESGLKIGLTTIHQKNFFPILFNQSMLLINRYTFVMGDNFDERLNFIRNDYRLLNFYLNLRQYILKR
ncbi:MAG: polysaccharide deacetylase family protein [Ignavibacteriales bacterium]|nr:MAG: polysaccharide deacetylase family protein [Ignavibacteriales bacterium]